LTDSSAVPSLTQITAKNITRMGSMCLSHSFVFFTVMQFSQRFSPAQEELFYYKSAISVHLLKN